MKKYIVLVFVFLSTDLLLNAVPPNNPKAYFHFKVQHGLNDTLLISTLDDPAAYMAGIIDSKAYTILPDKNGNFYFEFLGLYKEYSNRILLELRSGGKKILITKLHYLVEANDSINVVIDKLSDSTVNVNYSGRGAEKFTCRKKIDSVFQNTDLWNHKKYERTLTDFRKFWERGKSFQGFKILDSYKSLISPEAYQILNTDIKGKLLTNLDLISTQVYANCDESEKKEARKLFNELFHRENQSPGEKYELLSPLYFNYLMANSGSEVYMINKEKDVSLETVYSYLKNHYKGKLSEYLLTAMLFHGNRFNKSLDDQTVDSLWREVFLIAQTPILREFIFNRISRKSKGREGFEFSLADVNGNTLGLANFKGKVILMDFWYTGCVGCASYSARLEKYVYPLFKNNPEIAFVSVCGDRNKEQWLKSIKGGLYTRVENANLYTQGMGFDHPLTKYYDFIGGPYSLLIDKRGKIFSGNPPTNDIKELIKLLEKALSE